MLLGKSRNITQNEIEIFLRQYDLNVVDSITDRLAVVIESLVLHPLDEELSYEVYKKEIPSFKFDEFEKLYAKKITPNSLLMSLKLSNDQDRVVRLLKNESFDDEFYLKLFKLYDWQDEGVYDSDENRDVTMSFIKRFFKSDHFLDPATIYSPITLAKIISQSKDPNLLEASLYFPKFEFKTSKSDIKKPNNLKELIVLNPHTSLQTLHRVLNYKNDQIDYFLAQNPSIDESIESELFKRADEDTLYMLSTNENISDRLFELFLKDDKFAPTLLSFAKIDQDRFKKASKSKYLISLAQNEHIQEFAKELFELHKDEIDLALAQNSLVDSEILSKIFNRHKMMSAPQLSTNPNTPKDLLKRFFKLEDKEIDLNLSANPSTPQEILIKLYERDDYELNLLLAQNPSMPLEHLQQMQLDSRLKNSLSKNPTFTEKILNNLGLD